MVDWRVASKWTAEEGRKDERMEKSARKNVGVEDIEK